MSEEPSIVYGRLVESVYYAGHSFERAWQKLEWLLVGDRWQRVGPGYTDINAFLATIKLPEGVTTERRKTVAARIKALQPEASQRKIAGALGVGRATVQRDLGPDGPPQDTQPISGAPPDTRRGPSGPPPSSSGDNGAQVAREAYARQQAQETREAKRTATLARLDDLASREAKALEGVYDVVVIDPPWPMEKIERDVRPNQVAFDYPTMSEEEIAAQVETLQPFAADCHAWLWTTQRFLPMAFRLLDRWQLTYVCTFVWHKPGGFQPVGLPQYNAEFALYARQGAPLFADTIALPVCFTADREGHSVKPDAFYAMVRRVTAGRRLDMFNRRPLEGFDGWGKESHVDL